jgi:SSS family solute:Na+ symporter
VNHWLIVPLFVVGFLLASLYLGVRGGRGKIHGTADYVVGGRSLGLVLVFFVSVGEIYSSVAFLGQPGWAYEHGVGMLLPVGTFIPLMAFWLGPKIWHAGKNGGLITQAQFFGTQFNSQVLRSLAATIGLVALIPYIAVQMMGGGYILSVTTHGHIPFWLGSSVAFGVVATYVYSGGLRGISWVAVMKGTFMVVVGSYVVFRVTHYRFGGIRGLFVQLAKESPAHLTLPGPEHYVTYTFWSTSLLVSLLAFYMWPHLFANFFGAESPQVIRKQAIFLPLYNILTLMFILVGFAGILVLPSIKPDTVMVEMVMHVAPLWLVALFCAGALSASMVTGAACSLAAAATLGNDLLQPWLRLPDIRLKKLIQTLVFVVIVVAYLIGLTSPSTIVNIVLVAYGFTAQLFPITLAALYGKRITASSAIAGLSSGFVVVALFVLGRSSGPYGIHPGILGLTANVAAMLIVSKFDRVERVFPGSSRDYQPNPSVR